ncbi:ComEC family protein [Franconibacter daqui]|uniref:ComEC family protein n=1 Tax=Franconibacter daqui TaxID=2047724 RepID=A0ABV1PIJ6_9ENTR
MIALPALCVCVILGTLPLLFLPALPAEGIAITGALLACIGCRWLPGKMKFTAFITLFFCWAVLSARELVWPFSSLLAGNQRVEAVVIRTDGATEHQVAINKLNNRWIFPSVGVMLRGSYLPEHACAGQRMRMTLRLRPVHGQLNEGGFDNQRYALAQRLPLTGRIIDAQIISGDCSLRARYIASVSASLTSYVWRDVILALGFGERLTLGPEVKILLRNTGTAHLMAISGLHIGLAGSLGWLLARLLQLFLPAHRIGYRFPLLMLLVSASVYTWLAGSNPPAVRTLVAIFIWSLLRLSGRNWNAWQVWLCCVAGILFIEPTAVLSESLWLSAFAVAALIFWYQWMPFTRKPVRSWLRFLLELAHLQVGITLLLMPIQLVLFHGISLTSLAANLVAVPVITFIAVPLILTGMAINLTGWQWAEQGIWRLTDTLLQALFNFLRWLPEGWLDVDERYRWLALTPWLCIVLWRLRFHFFSPLLAVAAIALLSAPLWCVQKKPDWSLHMLDVGHGLAVVIERNGRAMLYDTGNGWPGGDSGQQIIIPWLRWHNLQPDGVILSHEHLDHRGGLESVLRVWPKLMVRSALGWARHQPCWRGETWRWEGLHFTVHWPQAGAVQAGNNGSCVVKIDDGRNSVLLTGDIEAPAELAMLKNYRQALRSEVLVVPHHGSRTSSSDTLLSMVDGKAALASVSRYNAWRLPSVKVTRRYARHGYRWHDTAQSGQITVIFSPEGWQIKGLREQILPRWYHQWFGAPADNR